MDRSAEWQYGLNEKKLINDFEEYGILLLKIFHCKLKVVCPSRFENLKQTDYEQIFIFIENITYPVTFILFSRIKGKI